MIVNPEIIVTPDYPVVRIRDPRENVDLDTVLPKILQVQGWGAGTFFHVQFLSHDKTRLLASAQFVVTEDVETLQTHDAGPYQTVTKAVANRKYARMTPWFETEANSALEIRWNPGKQAHEVIGSDGEVVKAFTKDDGGKTAAEAFVNGEQKAA